MRLLIAFFILIIAGCSSGRGEKVEASISVPAFSNALTATDFNCVAIAVNYPDESNDGFCINSSGLTEFRYNEAFAVYDISEPIDIEVFHGPNITFYVLGLKSHVDCVGLTSPLTFDLSQHSKPYLIGSVRSDIVQGEVNDLSIVVSKNSTKSMDKCDGNGFQYCHKCLQLDVDTIGNGVVLSH